MPLPDSEIADIVGRVLHELGEPGSAKSPAATGLTAAARSGEGKCVFADLDQAIEAAHRARRSLLDLGLSKRFEIIERIRQVSVASSEIWAKMAQSETGMGRVGDKTKKNLLSARQTPGPEDLRPESFTGDHGLTLVELAPFGVVGVITPSTNPTATVINNSISLISAGNGCVFNSHPAAKNVCRAAAMAINDAIVAAGGPENLITILAEPTQESAAALMKHRKIDLVLVTGGMPVVRLAMTSGNRAICAGPGNPPAIVDETAIIPKAAKDLVTGCGFDNNILCTDEKEIFVVDKVASQLKREMVASGAYEITGNDVDRLTRLLVEEDKIGKGHRHLRLHKRFVGKNLEVILQEINIKPPSGSCIGIMEVGWDHPLVMAEQLMPIIPLVRCRSFEQAMDWAIIAEHDFQHTFVMHSTNVANMSAMAQRCNGNIFVKNGANLAGLGYGGEGFTTMSIAGTTGEGLTRASTFTRPRRCTLVDYFRII
ncbi:MAG: aldehyde dehydrogenase EutE [candidate division Zixibacteria bacterium]|nr:aldehyde dehydrogenase EutE [candidate division Zixibacteria bacterium]